MRMQVSCMIEAIGSAFPHRRRGGLPAGAILHRASHHCERLGCPRCRQCPIGANWRGGERAMRLFRFSVGTSPQLLST